MERVILVVLASLLVLAGCSQSDSTAERQERQKSSAEQASKQGSSPTTPKFDPKGVGDTVEVGPLLVTLNDAKASSGGNQEDGANSHYFVLADLTLENDADAPLDASEADYVLRDEEGYSFEKKPLPEQKPQPEGQIVPGEKASGEVAFDLGTEAVKGSLRLFVSLAGRPDVLPAAFEFEVQMQEKKPSPDPQSTGKGNTSTSVEPDYKVIEDPTGGLSVEVPTSWGAEIGLDSEGAGGPNSWSYYAGESITSSITVARSLDAWYQGQGAEGGSGAYIVASRTLAQKYTNDELIYSLLFDGKANICTAGPYENYNRPPYSGKIQTWYDCTGYDNTSYVVAAAPEGRECVVVLGAKVAPGASEADRNAVQHILNSFEVNCGSLSSPPAPADTEASSTPSASATPSAQASAGALPQDWGPAYNFLEVPRDTPPCPLGLDQVREIYGPNVVCGEGGGYVPGPPGNATPTASPTPTPTATPTPTPTAAPTPEPSAAPGGGDIDCDEVDGPIYVGPNDPYNLDGDDDGWGCED